MAFTLQERAKYRQEQQELMSRQLEELATSWEQNPEEIIEYLDMQSRFYTYSPRNTALIYKQRPHAAFVGSFHTFQNMGYHVRKGEVGIRIRVPIPTVYYRLRPDRPWKRLTDASEETKRLIVAGAIESKEEISFGVGTVFAIEQTDCPVKDYPKIFGLGYDDAQHAAIYRAVKEHFAAIGMPVKEVDLQGALLRGRYFPSDGHIEVNSMLGDTQKLSTVLHEGAHALLQHRTSESTAKIEFEADALSILFTSHFGLEITPARREHFAIAYRDYRAEWAEGELLVDKLQAVAALFEKHIKPLSAAVQKVIRTEKVVQPTLENTETAPSVAETTETVQTITAPVNDESVSVSRRQPSGALRPVKKGFSSDVKQRLQDIPILEVCKVFGIDVKRSGSAGHYVCSVRPDDRDASCYIYPNNSFCDFGNANLGGDTIAFVEYVTGKDFYGACEVLAAEFGVSLERDDTAHKSGRRKAYDLTDRQFAQIGIQADLATKNFDLDVGRYGAKNTADFVARYQMSVQQLSRTYPDVYHNMLLARAIPYVYELRQEYYLACRSEDRLAGSVGHDILSDPKTMAQLETQRKELVAAESILKQAILDPTKIRYTTKTYDVAKDIEGIRAGTISIEVGTIRYAAFKAQTKDTPAERVCHEIPADEYFASPQFQSDIPHAAFLQGERVNVAYHRKYHKQLFPNVPLDERQGKQQTEKKPVSKGTTNIPIPPPPGRKR